MSHLQPLQEPLGMQRAAHLLRRSTWGPTPQAIRQWAILSPAEAFDRLSQYTPTNPNPPLDPLTMAPWLGEGAVKSKSRNETLKAIFTSWWVETMRTSALTLQERMVFFFHTHFSTQISRVPSTPALYHQLNLFRFYSLGNYRELVSQMARDMALMVNLDNQNNKAGAINENFAREFLELYVVGKETPFSPTAPYTEADVKAVARILSGYMVDARFANPHPTSGHPLNLMPKNGSGQAYLHDAAPKPLSEHYGHLTIAPNELAGTLATPTAALAELDQLLNALFATPYPAFHLARRLYHFFVAPYNHQAVETDMVEPLAQLIMAHDYQLAPVLRTLLCSQHFYDQAPLYPNQAVMGAIIKSPLEVLVGSLRFFHTKLPDTTLSDPEAFWTHTYGRGIMHHLSLMGLPLYDPDDIAGYPAYHQYPAYYRSWVTPNTITQRQRVAEDLIRPTPNPHGYHTDVMEGLHHHQWATNPEDPATVLQLATLALSHPLPYEQLNPLETELRGNISPEAWQHEWQQYVQGNDTGTLRHKIQGFLSAIIQSMEYQLL